ncbi:MAG: class I SAM-dependent RNA methyltransferase [Peptococcaceae bacterium]|nr:class I SAM-dependent RNA methyltransferase [Peptococcaceae bacterium]
MKDIKITVTSAFGVEGLLRRELNRLGYTEGLTVGKGGVSLSGGPADIVRLNLWVRQGERVVIEAGSFPAATFEELFQGVTALPWENWLTADAAFPVNGKCVKSTLHSVPDCQSIIKKAIVERLRRKYPAVSWFAETGPVYPVDFKITNDIVTVVIDSSGEGLHKRGWRKLGSTAPLKETLASVLLTLSNWRPNQPLADPFCGSGTIPIEAALKAMNIAPGLNRSFACQAWPQISAALWKAAREEAAALVLPQPDLRIEGYDIDEKVLSLARYHAKLAGVEGKIHFQRRDVADFKSSRKYGAIITNPPYGQRLGQEKEAAELYRLMGQVFASLDTWSFYILTSHQGFEEAFGGQATKNTKLFNGFLECRLFQFHGPRPPRLQ